MNIQMNELHGIGIHDILLGSTTMAMKSWKKLYVVMCYLKAWQHYLGTHKTKVYTNNISLQYFETQPKVSTKQLKWHDTLALLDVELIHKLGQNNVVFDALNRKEEHDVPMGGHRGDIIKKVVVGKRFTSPKWMRM